MILACKKEAASGENTGIFIGKLRIQTLKKTSKDSKGGVTFRGKWKNYAGNPEFEVWWANFVPTDISKVALK
ncbi:hypothetical protein SD427_07600 [Chryseobacterium sp. JJR-5R]|uniref:hypothetical protein n=1 Tax=Chryseobacterium sp. JJR-5R TaxID=3093923 RepID=UPI002A749DBF|nr:hypothetical protein [Chryseobacterium sp. JJR-5R]WPO84187.1 hypothetical protein SD427_07600 [Chryseobacterium sp. JJR-5R]